jgi:hypothetical protein
MGRRFSCCAGPLAPRRQPRSLVVVEIRQNAIGVERESPHAGVVAEVVGDEGVAFVEPVLPDFAARRVADAVRVAVHRANLRLAHADLRSFFLRLGFLVLFGFLLDPADGSGMLPVVGGLIGGAARQRETRE